MGSGRCICGVFAVSVPGADTSFSFFTSEIKRRLTRMILLAGAVAELVNSGNANRDVRDAQ
jgi:hypothetical protein